MSKVVKSVVKGARSIAKAVTPKAIWNVGSKIGKAIEKNKILKTIAIAAAVYFTGGAAMGAISGASAAGAGFGATLSGAISGAGTGIASAWAGVTGAASAVAAGNLSGAVSSLGAGWSGATMAGANAASGAALQATAAELGGGFGAALQNSASQVGSLIGSAAPSAVSTAAPGGSSPGLIGGAMKWAANNPYIAGQALNVGGKVLAGVAQAKQQQGLMDQREEQDEEARRRYNANMAWQPKFGG